MLHRLVSNSWPQVFLLARPPREKKAKMRNLMLRKGGNWSTERSSHLLTTAQVIRVTQNAV
ncbi:hypothetical protein AAY473_028910 [Plecturocebus cupreus]